MCVDCTVCLTFSIYFSHLADALIRSDLQSCAGYLVSWGSKRGQTVEVKNFTLQTLYIVCVIILCVYDQWGFRVSIMRKKNWIQFDFWPEWYRLYRV